METLRFESEGDVDNTVSYTLYSLTDGVATPCRSFVAASSVVGSTAALMAKVERIVQPYVKGYIWHRDAFRLSTSETPPPWSERATEGPPYLWGHVRYGDTVEEEWFVVGLLLAVTRTVPDVVAQIWDSDGEFLLIEAAYALPKWLKPETSPNRVWLRSGEVHILKRRYGTEEGLKIEHALEILKSDQSTRAKDSIQKCIAERVGSFPDDSAKTQHWARCYVPVKVAHVLAEMPFLISPAVECFVQREGSAMSALAHPAYLQPEGFVMAMVKFHRCSYAQLVQSEFYPPRWYPLLDSAHPNFKAAELGMKITFAMELLCRRHLTKTAGSDPTADALRASLAISVSGEEFMKEHALFPEDDDGWLQGGEAELESELQKRAAEQQRTKPTQSSEYDPEALIRSFGSFVQNVSSHEGAEMPAGVELNMHRFMEELNAVMGDDFTEQLQNLDLSDATNDESDALSDSDTYGSSASTTESHESTEVHHLRIETAGDVECQEEADSDDDSEFGEAYAAVLDSELDQTKMQESFIKKGPSSGAGDQRALREVDLDVNLVENLLESYSQQRGRPGPVGNIAGLLELQLPRNDDAAQPKRD